MGVQQKTVVRISTPVRFCRYLTDRPKVRLRSNRVTGEILLRLRLDLNQAEDALPRCVRYDAVNAMLLNEFLKEHSKVEKLEATIAKQHTDFQAALASLNMTTPLCKDFAMRLPVRDPSSGEMLPDILRKSF